jgi:hypothetical protein
MVLDSINEGEPIDIGLGVEALVHLPTPQAFLFKSFRGGDTPRGWRNKYT